MYVTLAATETPVFANASIPLTDVLATAVAGSDSVVVTSASADTTDVPLAEFGCALAPSLVVVAIDELTETLLLDGAVKLIPRVIADPAPRAGGMPVNVMTPVPAL